MFLQFCSPVPSTNTWSCRITARDGYPWWKVSFRIRRQNYCKYVCVFNLFLLLKSTSWGIRSYFASYEKWTNGSILLKIKESEIAEEILKQHNIRQWQFTQNPIISLNCSREDKALPSMIGFCDNTKENSVDLTF